MNIVINPNNFDSKCIFFLDKKKNNIINGCFSKIVYSPEYFTMNGIFFVIPFTIKSPIPNLTMHLPGLSIADNSLLHDNKYTVSFYTHDIKNLQYITLLSKIENAIINTYKETNGLKKRINLGLTNQLYKGFFKIYKEKRGRTYSVPKLFYSQQNNTSNISGNTTDLSNVLYNEHNEIGPKVTNSFHNNHHSKSYTLTNGGLSGDNVAYNREVDAVACNRDSFSILHSKEENEKNNKYMLKISGVWENAEEIGITYKFIEI